MPAVRTYERHRSMTELEKRALIVLYRSSNMRHPVVGPRWVASNVWRRAAHNPGKYLVRIRRVLSSLKKQGLVSYFYDTGNETNGWCLTSDGYEEAKRRDPRRIGQRGCKVACQPRV